MRVVVSRLGERPLFFSLRLPDLFSSLPIVFPHSSPRTAFLIYPVCHGQTVRVFNYIYSSYHPPTSSYQQSFPSRSPSDARPPIANAPCSLQAAPTPPPRPAPTPPVASGQPSRRLASPAPAPASPQPRVRIVSGRQGRDTARVASPQTVQARERAAASDSVRRRSALGASFVQSVIDRITLLTCHHRSMGVPIRAMFVSLCYLTQHYSHGPYPPSFYPYPYHHQNMPHRVEDMSIDRSIRFAPPSRPIRTPVTHILTSHSHRSDGQAQYQFMPPHSHPTPPPIATLHHSPALSASSLESNSISPSPPVRALPPSLYSFSPHSPFHVLQITQPSTPYYSHPGQAPPMSQAPPYPYQPNGSIARYADDQSAQGYPIPPHSAQSLSRSIRPTMVATQPYPGQANYIIHTDDASTKLSDRVRRKCYNCRTTDTSTWRRSSLTPGKVVSAAPSCFSFPSSRQVHPSITGLMTHAFRPSLTRHLAILPALQQVWSVRAHAFAPASRTIPTQKGPCQRQPIQAAP